EVAEIDVLNLQGKKFVELVTQGSTQQIVLIIELATVGLVAPVATADAAAGLITADAVLRPHARGGEYSSTQNGCTRKTGFVAHNAFSSVVSFPFVETNNRGSSFPIA